MSLLTQIFGSRNQRLLSTYTVDNDVFEDDDKIFAALRAGASGYLVKGEPMEKIIQSIQEANKGGAPMSFSIAKRVLHHFQESKVIVQDLATLTPTERDVLELLSEGLLYKEIADKMFCSPRTVESYRDSLFEKLELKTRVGLAVFALKNGFSE